MSLLLDALKKAANEKKSAGENVDSDAERTSLDVDPSTKTTSNHEQEIESLSIDGLETEASNEGDVSAESLTDNSTTPENVATPLTVSSEALQVLVHKTNIQFRESKARVWKAVAASMLVVLVSGGYYFYSSMEEDMASIERQHRVVMRSVSDTKLSRTVIEKVEQQKNINDESRITPAKKPSVKKAETNKLKTKLVISKKEKLDPVNVLATKAWNAYSDDNYQEAKLIYARVLLRERNNRDALLGIAAIAVKQHDIDSAKAIYRELIGLNPRDSIAVAALSNLQNTNIGQLNETKLKRLIRQNVDSAHLNFALGNVYSQQSRWAEAQQSYFKAWKSETNNADYAFNLAVSLDQLGKQNEAIKYYKMSLSNSINTNVQFLTEAVEFRIGQLTDGKN